MPSPASSAPAEEPWRACYRELAPRLLLFARQWLPSAADAEDAVQNGFIRFWQKQPDAQPEHYPLLYSAVRSAAIDLIRSSQRRTAREERFDTENRGPEPVFDSQIGQQELSESIQSALERLPQEQRETLVLRIWGELTFAQIAEALGESINTIASRHRYALQALRRLLKPAEHERI